MIFAGRNSIWTTGVEIPTGIKSHSIKSDSIIARPQISSFEAHGITFFNYIEASDNCEFSAGWKKCLNSRFAISSLLIVTVLCYVIPSRMKACSSSLFEHSTLILLIAVDLSSHHLPSLLPNDNLFLQNASTLSSIIKQNKTIKHNAIAAPNDNYSVRLTSSLHLARSDP